MDGIHSWIGLANYIRSIFHLCTGALVNSWSILTIGWICYLESVLPVCVNGFDEHSSMLSIEGDEELIA